ncbi:hypothetical protein LUZ63_001879 [Rhynchospora breviuscula]|uniref:Uncharacterized protein n=1 Tax=Rhynchospora breviuscula TaxID=2022672 RepID=A0A9Q0CXR6_9POAL|nr:hypothetical protein LUZ63_001879 [Rhynchospora breviuscula]
MKITVFIILFTLATAIARETPLTTTNKTPLYMSLGQELRGLLAKAGSIWSSPSTIVNATTHHTAKHRSSKMRIHGGKPFARSSVNCISAELCNKKKLICTKLCNKARVNTNHITNKCYLKCSKCKPTC